MDKVFTYDRTGDVSKLEGCNTRGIEYRWSIFSDAISRIPPGNNALDFGAGSLRESFDLICRGFNVISVDIDEQTLSSYQSKYQWPDNGTKHELIAASNLPDTLLHLGDKKFALVICFDALEHVEDPIALLRAIREKMTDEGLLFITVPNGRTLFELAFRLDLILARTTKKPLPPGVPHFQRNSPEQWKRIISSAGLKILAHDMQIGFFANTFAALVQIPLGFSGRVLRTIGVNVDAIGLAKKIYSGPQAATLDLLDRHTKPIFRGLYGWNLFIVGRR